MTLVVVGLIAMAVAMVVVLRERPVAHPVPPVPAVRTTTPPAVARGVAAQPGETSAPAAPGALPAAVPGTDGAAGELVVSVVGLVHKIGLVRLPAGSRVADAVAAAGGAREGADLTGLNLAQRLTDGDQVLVAPASPSPGPPQLGSATIGATGRASSTAKPDSGAISPNSRVNLNTATESDLDALPGVGPVTARAIITWRTANGRFTDLEQLGEIDGIGPTRLARLRNLVTV
ncbi:ComEA family DNA-binding protein [Nocardia sp. NPDC050710]|uniref:ComEA family DNA-binding protein n=1 Tax=Nocardia sp. NPDC050710 TaxID=3157220 RepID=UPI0033C1126A